MMGTPSQSHYPVFTPSFSEPLLSIGFLGDRPFPLPDDPSSVTVATSHNEKIVHGQGDSYGQATTISMLPENVLLQMFDFYRKKNYDHDYPSMWKWHTLVHVCQRWRQIVFASPRRLNLRILCTPRTPVRKTLSIWPPLPIYIDYHYHSRRWRRDDTCSYDASDNDSDASQPDEDASDDYVPDDDDHVITALEHLDRVCAVALSVTRSEWEKIATVMQQPFPALTSLHIVSEDWNAPVLPVEFLGGSAPCLQTISFGDIPFPALPTLLLSTSNLSVLELHNIPPTGYISPQAMVASLGALSRLESLLIGFPLTTSRPDQTGPLPVTRTVLPALTSFQFRGASEYLEDFVARIDGPRLNDVSIEYLDQLVDFQVAQLSKFVDRTVGPKLALFRHASVTFHIRRVTFNTYRRADDLYNPDPPSARTVISCQGINWEVLYMAQVLSQILAKLSNVVHLNLQHYTYFEEDRQSEGTDVAEWVHLLHQFSAVQTLHVSRDIAGYIALTPEGITKEMIVSDVLPSLDLIYLEGQPASSVEKFVAARRLSDRPVTVVDAEKDFNERLESYFSE